MQVEIHVPRPDDPLHPYVQHFFGARSGAGVTREIILPKGNVDFLFSLGTPCGSTAPGHWQRWLRTGFGCLEGLKTVPFAMQASGAMDLVGVSLRAEAAAAILPVSPGEVVNAGVLDHGLLPGLEELTERLYEASTFMARCKLIGAWLLARTRPRRGADAARRACELLRRAPADDPIHGVARTLCVSPRHLRRLVREHVGISPAEYVRLWRFTESLHLLRVPRVTIGAVAHAAGYYDHAHFCRDFRRFAGMTPQDYRADTSHPVPGHIVQR